MSSHLNSVLAHGLLESLLDRYLESSGVWLLDDDTLSSLLSRIMRMAEARRPGVVQQAVSKYYSGVR